MGELSQNHWGDWLLARAHHVGFQRQEDLATEVGCRREQIARWGSMKVPPGQIRKGFDHKLAWALRTSPETLFKGWINTPPEKARRFNFSKKSPPGPEFFERATARQMLEEFFDGCVLPNLNDQQLEELIGSALVMLAMTKGEIVGTIIRGFDHPLLKRLKGFFAEASRPPLDWQTNLHADEPSGPVKKPKNKGAKRT